MLLTDHPDERALYTGVLANPLDDAPRLILADWYEENGYEWRADMIRQDNNATRISDNKSFRQYLIWWQRLSLSLSKYGVWLSELLFDRGFVSEITINEANWNRYYLDLLSEHPLRFVNIPATQNTLAQRLNVTITKN